MHRLPRTLRRLTLLAAVLLALGVALAPLAAPAAPRTLFQRAVWLFANDAAVRRAALAAALGLTATAVIFFRPRRPDPGEKGAGGTA